MKKIFYTSIVFTFLCVNTLFSQSLQNSLPVKFGEYSNAISTFQSKGFSPYSAFLLMDIDKQRKDNKTLQITDSTIIEKYNLFLIANEPYVNSFLVVSEEFDKSDFEKNGFFVNSQSQNIVTASIPVNKLEGVITIKGVLYVQIAEKAHLALDNARSTTWVDWVHQGQDLPQSYLGNGVVIGIIDNGFDYTHPNFFDGTGTNNYRVKKVWEQNATSGTPPSGFSYGRELATQTAILNAQRDKINESHGTHVAGIAAGAGGGVNTTYSGVAPQSELVFVSATMTDVGFADGIQYIISYANSVNKPCVINMSFGKHFGSHDGLSAFDQYCDRIVGDGRILVGAAGNEGGYKIYLGKSYTSSDNTLYTFLTNRKAAINIWGNPNQNYEVAVNIYNTNTNSFEDYTPYIQANSNNVYGYTLYDDDIFFPDPCYVTIAAETYPLNNKRCVVIEIDDAAQDDSYRRAMIEIRATTGQTKMWALNTEFTNAGKSSPFMNGSTNSTVGEIGGTGKKIISVGAYNTTVSQVGGIASFSSKGPTADGRTKPDITAPGNRITSSVSRFDANYLSGGSNWSDVVTGITDGTNTWRFARMQGTSMATPMVTGIIALWLQAYPNLNPTQALKLLKDNAWTDNYTGSISSNGSNTWGWGKVDAHEGLLDLLTKIPPQPTITPTMNVAFCQGESTQLSAPNGYSAYQWSNNATTRNVTISNSGNYSVRVTNNQGYISPWSASKVVTVYSNPHKPTITINGNVLTSSATSGNQWYYNNNAISGATQRSFTAERSGSYYVIVTNSNNCTNQSNTVTVNVTSIEELSKFSTTSVYPNPTNEYLNIQFSDFYENIQLEIYDLTGRLHIRQKVNSIGQDETKVLNISNLANGVYALKIYDNEKQATFKIVVSK
jgi:subtilisin family serine protease